MLCFQPLLCMFVLLCLLGCQSNALMPFSKEKLDVARAHQATFKHIQSKVRLSALQKLKKAKPTLKDIKWMSFQPLKQGALGTKVHRIDLTAEVFDFSFGKSWYKAFRLPQQEKPYQLVIYSYADNAMRAGTVFYPVLVFVDYAFNITRVVVPDMQDNDALFMKLTAKVQVNPKSYHEAYVIVATSEQVRHKKTAMLSISPLGFQGDPYSQYAKTGIPNMQYVVHERAHSPQGSVKFFWDVLHENTAD